ncbi:MAG: hypothetical protein KA715_09730 [Xanthomonadaceae bacterium]|nr:hypothetical protein [Xanthomonadaceae bacterium]
MKKILIAVAALGFNYSVCAGDLFEIVTWKFRPEISITQAQEATKGLDKFLKSVKGFKKRSTYFSKESGHWVDVVTWKNIESARAALKAAETHRSYLAFRPLVDEKSVNLSHYEKR